MAGMVDAGRDWIVAEDGAWAVSEGGGDGGGYARGPSSGGEDSGGCSEGHHSGWGVSMTGDDGAMLTINQHGA